VHKGDVFIVNAATGAVQFKVISTNPSPYCIVAPDTIIYCEGDPIKREEEQEALWNEIDFDDVGGLENAKRQLKELIESSQESFNSGIKPSRGVLIYGPSGCGK
jgi:transitional endoplasmic reticulum ATPase